MEKMEQTGAEGGNTESPPAKREIQHFYWCFTFNNYSTEQMEQMEQILKHECKWYVFQEEIGESGTPHLQGTIYLKNKQRRKALSCWNPKVHWEPTKSVQASLVYCTKKESGQGKIHSNGIELPEELKLHEPRGWQLEIMDIIEQEPDERTIHWYWEKEGNKGKTVLCKYLVAKHNALMLTGKSNDMYHMISKMKNKRKIFIVDIPRSTQDYINYGAIEQIKNGLVFSGKYEGDQLIFNCPHVIVFANQRPDFDKMSKDRWHIRNI